MRGASLLLLLCVPLLSEVVRDPRGAQARLLLASGADTACAALQGLHAEGEGDFARDEAPAHFSGRAEAALPSLGLLRGSLARRRADLEGLLAGPAD